jgi:hypothetical protein
MGMHRWQICKVGEYSDVLTSKLGLAHLIEYSVSIKDPKLVRLAPYCLSPPKMKILREHVQTLLQQGIIEPSVSAYSSPKFLVPKREDTFRAIIDYHALNKCTDIELVPLPDIHSFTGLLKLIFYYVGLESGILPNPSLP